jgi:hypothetical protein
MNAREHRALNQAQLYENMHRIAETIEIQISINFFVVQMEYMRFAIEPIEALRHEKREERSELFVKHLPSGP